MNTMGENTQIAELAVAMVRLENEMARLAERLALLEGKAGVGLEAAQKVGPEPIPEDVVLVIAAAVAAFLGKRGQIRQIRLIGSAPWAQQGRVSIQASHRLERTHG